MDLNYINKLIDVEKYYLYHEYKPILSANNLKQLRQEIKNNINPLKKDKKMFVVHFGINDDNNKKMFVINCVQYTLTKSLTLVIKDDDYGQTIIYSKKELEKRKFKLTDIVKIMKAIDENTISFELSYVPIKDIIKH